MVRECRIKVSRSARYYTLGPDDGSVRELWFVLHGYGQLAAQFIRLFEPLDDGTRLIVAPEALNRFYVAGVEEAPAAERAVGATWMTREDRDHEIEDYVAYLDGVAREAFGRLRARATVSRSVVFGFSQGTATAGRWIAHGGIQPAQVILWGGFLPPDVDLTAPDQPLRRPSLHMLIGTRDRFVSADRVSAEETRLRDAGVVYRLTRYRGGHGIAKDALHELSRALAAGA